MKYNPPNKLAEAELTQLIAVFQDLAITVESKRQTLENVLAATMPAEPVLTLRQRLKALVKEAPMIRRYLAARYATQFATYENCNLFLGAYSDFASATAATPKTKVVGYDNPEPASMYRDYVVKVAPMEYPALLWLSALLKDCGSILDFGGHVGITFYTFETWLRFSKELSWKVYDVPAVVRAGASLASEKKEGRLRFTNDDSEIDGVDLFYAAGSLQYNPKTPFQLLSPLARRPRYVLLNKQPLTDQKECVTIQNIGTAFCPYRIYNRAEFVGSFESLGYELIHSWATPGLTCRIPYEPRYSDIRYDGFCFKLRS